MATGLDLIREENPALALIPDDELIERLLEQYQGDLDPDTYIESLLNEMPVESPVVSPTGGKRAFAPAESPRDIGFGQALVGPAKSSWARSWGPSITRLRGGIAGLFGYEDTAQQLYQQAAEQDRNILQDSGYVSFAQATQGPDAGVSTFVKAGLSATGQSSPYLIEGITGALAGAKIGRFAGPVGALVGAGVGAAVASFPRLFEFNVSRQQEQVSLGNLDNVNEGTAALYALPQAALESVMFPVMGKMFGALSKSQKLNILNQATLGRVAKGTSIGTVTEAATEVGQQVLERYQAGLPIDTPEAIAEYTEAAYAGGFVGGLLGGVTTTAGEATRAIQPKPQEQKIEEPKVQEGIQQKPEATVLPEQQKAQSVNLAKEEEVKPATFNVEQQGDKFALNKIDDTGKKITVGGPFNTQEEATAKQQEIENQKSKVSQQSFFTKDEIIKENPAIGNIINELEEQGNTIAPHVKQVYFQKNLALPKGDFTNVQASGGTSNSIVDGWFDRTRDYVAIGTADLSKASETVGHENFHALQRRIDQGYASGLFKQDEQAALDSYFPDNQSVDSIPQSVQKGLGKDVMARLKERHADRTLSSREMQAYAFGAYSSLKAQGKRLAAPNPVIRAFQRLFELIKRAGNVFRKNKVNSVQDLFEKARTGEIGKRAVPKKGIEKLQTEGIAQAEEVAAKGLAPITSDKKLSLTTPIIDKAGKTFSTILPTISPIGEFVAKQSYQRGLGGARLQKIIEPYAKNAVSKSDVDGSVYSKALSDIQSNETELNQNKEYISIRDAEGNSTTLGDTSGRLVNKDYGQPELERLGNAYGTLLKVQAPTVQYALSTVPLRKKPPTEKIKNIKSAGEFFDNMVEPTDIMDNKAFKKSIKETAKEVEFQKDRVLNGLGWYSKDATTTFNLLEKAFPTINTSANDQDIFTAITAILSPNRDPQQNVVLSSRVFDYYKKHGSIPVHNPATKKFWTLPNSAKQLSLFQYLLDKYGENGTVEFLRSKKTIRQMKTEMGEAGANGYNDVSIGMKYKSKDPNTKEVTTKTLTKEEANYKKTSKPSLGTGKGLDDEFLGSMIFGPKVGRFFLDIRNIQDETEADGVTKDVWFSRSFYRQFGQLTDKTPSSKDGLKGTILKKHEKRADEWALALAKETNLSPNDAQAALWYYEHELYADILKSPSKVKLYALSDGAKKFIKDLNDGKYKEIESGQPSRSVEVRKRIKIAEDKEKELSVSERKETEKLKSDLELSVSPDTALRDTDIDAFQESGSDVSAYSAKEYNKAKITRGPLVGHCAACAYVLQKNYGGDIYNVIVTPREGYNTSREKHYFNKLPNGNFIDLTGEQYGNEGITPPQDFINRAKISKYQWGRFDPSKSDKENKEIAGVKSVNSKFIKFEENVSKKRLAATGFGMSPRAALGEPELSVSENLQDVIPTEFSVSDKKLDGKVDLVFFDEPSPDFYDAEVGETRIMEIDSGEKLKRNEDFGDTTGRYKIGINVNDKPVGVILGGVTEDNTFYVANTEIFGQWSIRKPSPVASVSLWKQVAKQIKNRLGVTRYSGQRITGARAKFGVVADKAFITRDTEFSVSEEDIKVANLTSRNKGAVGEQAIVPKWIEENVDKKSSILDYGAGKSAQHTERLKGKGYNVTAYEFGDNVNTDIHDVNALNKKYDVVYASNVLNVQNSEEILNTTLQQISNSLNEDGFAIINLPTSPRKGFYEGKTASQGAFLLEEKLVDIIGDIQRVGGVPSAPIYKVEKVSQDKKIKYGLEFSVSKEKFSEGTERVLGNINPARERKTIPGYWKSLTTNFGIRAHQGIVDQYSSVKKYIGEEPYKLLTMTHSSSGAIEGALNYGVPFLDKDGAIDLKDNTLGTGLFTRLEKLGETLPDFLAWVAANRAKYLTTVGKETGLGNIEDINTAIKELPKGKEKLFNEVNKDINEFRDAFLQIARDSGYLSQEAYNAWTGQAGYNFYIPFYRLLEDETSRSGPQAADSIIDQPEVKKYVGSTLPVKDLFSNMLQNFNFLAEASLRNQAGLKTLEQGVAMGVTRKVDGPTKDSVFARKNGKQVHYEIDEPLVLQSLEALNWSGWSNPAMGILRNFKRYLTIGVTASPAFRIRNLIRDTIHSIAVSKISYNPLNNVLQGGKGFSLKGRKLSEARAKMAFGGGEIHFGHIYGGDPNATQMLLDRNIDLNTVMRYDGWTEGSKRFFKSKVGKGLDWWQEVGNTAENVNRSALYQQLRDKGVSHFEASYEARDLLNFSRHGANPAIRFLTQSIPFLNARIQGLDKAGRAFNQGQRAQLLTTLGAYSLASVGLYLAFKDDDDFKDREQWDRDTYHWFKIPGSETAFRIPRPFEVGSVGVMFERMVEQMVDDDVHGSLFAERMLHTITETFAIDYKPQLITPALEVYANKDTFTKRPIQSNWMEKLPPSERKYAYTSSAYVNTSKALELIPWKAIQYSPVQIEHLVQGYFGWVGSSVAQVISFSDYPRKFTQFTSAESPLFMGFVKPLPSIRTKYKTEFYEAMREMNEVNALMNMYMKTGETDKAMKVYNKNKNLIAWRSTYVKTNTQITKINRQIKLIESQNISEKEKYLKVKQLNLLKAQIMRTLKENVLAYEKANDTRVKRPLWWK